MSAANFNTSNQTLRQLLGNGLSYIVPRFQRDYSWTQDEWDDLWQDMQGTLSEYGEPVHYMGYLVLQTGDSKTFQVIDGQQRLTTLTIFVLAALRVLQDLVAAKVDSEDNLKRIEQLRQTFIGFLDPVTLVSHNKLTLNRNNDGYFKDHLVRLSPQTTTRLKPSEKLLQSAFEWFYRKVASMHNAKQDGTVAARLVDMLSDKLLFTVIYVTDELNAYKVFETLNARGVRLSPTDLLKNYLFSIVSRDTARDEEVDDLERRWQEMVTVLGSDDFPDFLRVHWNSRRKTTREADLFKTIRESTRDRAAVFELLRQMKEDVGVYAALSSPEDRLWLEHEQQRSVTRLRMFRVRQPWPLLLAAHRALGADQFASVLRACVVVSLRYNVISGLAANEQERTYGAVARRIADGELKSDSTIIRELRPVYVPDNSFLAAFSDKSLRTGESRNRRVVRDILAELEFRASGVRIDAENAAYTIEHILPENPSGSWDEFQVARHDDFVYRLGNLTLLEEGLNREAANQDFAAKRAIYRRSNLKLNEFIATENSEWTPERLAHRQRWMAQQAIAIWRLSQFDSR